MKLKALALAALLAASGAHAAIDSGFTSGNGSLLATVAYGTSTNGASATFDLGVSYSDVAGWQSSINAANGNWFRSWNLSTGMMSGTGIGNTLIGNYGTSLSLFNTAATSANAVNTAQLAVFAFDGTGTNPGEAGVFTTAGAIVNNTTGVAGVAPTAPFNEQVTNLVLGPTNLNSWLVAANLDDSHATDGNGANFAANGSNAYFNNTNLTALAQTGMFDVNGQYAGNYTTTNANATFAGLGKLQPFYQMVASSNDPSVRSALSLIGYDADGDNLIELDNNGSGVAGGGIEAGRWTLQGDVLTFSVSAVPEPESYAMLLAGLGLMGAIARRRKQA